jgi:thiol:disulfide interchange protein DsbD
MFSFWTEWFMMFDMTYRFLNFSIFTTILLLCSNFGSSAHAGAVPSPEYAQVQLVPGVTTIAPGDHFTVYIDQIITPEWHTYWKNPGDSGMPTTTTWELPDGVTVSDLTYPTPMRISFGPLTNFGYETRAVFTQKLNVPSDRKSVV